MKTTCIFALLCLVALASAQAAASEGKGKFGGKTAAASHAEGTAAAAHNAPAHNTPAHNTPAHNAPAHNSALVQNDLLNKFVNRLVKEQVDQTSQRLRVKEEKARAKAEERLRKQQEKLTAKQAKTQEMESLMSAGPIILAPEEEAQYHIFLLAQSQARTHAKFVTKGLAPAIPESLLSAKEEELFQKFLTKQRQEKAGSKYLKLKAKAAKKNALFAFALSNQAAHPVA
jgi:hypothetical protein